MARCPPARVFQDHGLGVGLPPRRHQAHTGSQLVGTVGQRLGVRVVRQQLVERLAEHVGRDVVPSSAAGPAPATLSPAATIDVAITVAITADLIRRFLVILVPVPKSSVGRRPG